MNTRLAALMVTTLVLLAGIALATAGASTIKWVAVPLGTHQFGHLRVPDAIVAKAGPNEIAFKSGGTGCGCTDGPGGPVLFDVERNGSIWLFDVLNHRLLVWRPGHPAHPTRTINLTGLDVRDFALGRDGTIYLYAIYAEPPAGDSGANLWALTPKGKVLWRAHALMGNGLRIGPSGALYSLGARAGSWTPLTTSTGRPLSLPRQRQRTRPFQPLSGFLHLVANQLDVHEVHFALVDRTGKVIRAWRVTSRTKLALAPGTLIPAMVGGELVVQVDASRQAKGRFLREHQILRLSPGGSRASFSVDAKALCCNDGTGALTPLRIASDGRLYQLRTNPKTGATIARYSLAARKES